MPALVTPFDEHGDLDLDAHRHNVATLSGRGVGGFLIAGSTGEGPYLGPGERHELLVATREELGDDPFLLCGVAGESIRQAVEHVAEATEGGADAALVLTPTSLIRGDDGAVHAFYVGLAAVDRIPLLLYSVPRVTGYELPVDAAVDLLRHQARIVGIKDSGGQPVRIQQMATAVGDGAWIFAGSSAAVSLSVAGGGYGAITASANYAPTLVREVVDAARKGGAARAADAQARLTRLTQLVETRGLAGIKLAAEVAGLRPGRSRAPLSPLSESAAEPLRRQLGLLRSQLLG